jgi:hypothetical protein
MSSCKHRPSVAGVGALEENLKRVLRYNILPSTWCQANEQFLYLPKTLPKGEEASCPYKSSSTILHSSFSYNASGIK